jgi:thioredoxin reductase/bacterioferritin-associated ferredoxin
MNEQAFDLVIVGGGPAGLAAAAEAAGAGATVAVVDHQMEPGGQIFRAAERRAGLGDAEADHGAALVKAARAAGMRWFGGQSVWQVTPDLRVFLGDGSRAHFLQARHLILATGAHERPMPIPGWTLPGVMTAGAGQILLKSARTVPQGDIWLAGSGPLLLLLAWQWHKAGVALRGVLDTTPRGNLVRAARHFPAALPAWRELMRGVHWRLALMRAGISWTRVDGGLQALGTERIERVAWQSDGKRHEAAADGLFLHHGVIPHTRLAQGVGASMRWDERQRCHAPVVDEWCSSSVPGVAIAGDGGGIAGAAAAERQGRIAALQALYRLGLLDEQVRDRRAAPLRQQIAHYVGMRPFLDVAFAPANSALAPTDPSTTVCRCECVTAGQVREVIAAGATSVQEVKLATRCAMGPCQGRQCAATLQELVSAQTGSPMQFLRQRSPAEPVTLGEWANLANK